MLRSRSSEPEIIDLGPNHYSKEEYEDCLIKLDHIGRWLGGDRASFAAMRKMNLLSILDVGCGGGLFTTKLALRYPHARVVGIDLNANAIDFAKRRLASMKRPPANLSFETRAQEGFEKSSFDVVISTLVCHHLSDENLKDFISHACLIAKKKVILNDLQRHPAALFLFKIISPIFFPNRLIQHDGALSIRRAFTFDELIHCLKMAGLKPSQYSIRWQWAFRWIVEINCERGST